MTWCAVLVCEALSCLAGAWESALMSHGWTLNLGIGMTANTLRLRNPQSLFATRERKDV